MKHITREHKHWQIKGDLKRLLMECKAKQPTPPRYSLNEIYVRENKLIATDGKRLVEISIKHDIEPGNYFCTSDGFLLKTEGKFPKYESIIPKKGALRKIVKVTEGYNASGFILGRIIYSGCITSLSLYRKPIELLERLRNGKVEVFVYRSKPEIHPFVIEAETILGKICYVQMPMDI